MAVKHKQANDFIMAKLLELAEYMETQGYAREQTASVMLGVAAGWIAARRGADVAYQSLDMARLSIENHLATKQ